MAKNATIYRMVTPDHLCPWGLKAHDLLRRAGYEIEDHHLESQEANRRYKEKERVDETPQIWIATEYIGGYDDLRRYLDKEVSGGKDTTYQPVIAIFVVAFLMAITATLTIAAGASGFPGSDMFGELETMGWGAALLRVAELFIAISMCFLGVQKLQDLEGFSVGFLGYDLVARRWVPYAYIYPFIEAGSGVLMIAGLLTWLAAPLALVIGTIGAISVLKAVYLDKRVLKCACVGGDSSVPLGFISLTENVMMIVMSLWMLAKVFWIG